MVAAAVLADPTSGSRFVFNISANVGPGCPNRQDDVQFVQLGYFAMVRSPANQSVMGGPVRSALEKIVPGDPYMGGVQDPLTLAINAHEAQRGGTKDGHVSVINSAGKYGSGPSHTFIVIALNNSLIEALKRDYPRLDKHPQCPGLLRTSVLKILTGSVV